MILCVGPTPTAQRTMVFDRLEWGEVNRTPRVFDAASGKSINVARVLRALGEAVVATGFLGGDRGAWIRRELSAVGIGHDFVEVETPTRLCVTVVASRSSTELIEESAAVESESYERLLEKSLRLARGARLVVASGSLTPGGPTDFYGRLVREMSRIGVECIVDAAGEPLKRAVEAGPLLVKPNRSELAAAVGEAGIDVEAGARRLAAQGARSVVVSLGPAGAIGIRGAERVVVEAPQVEAVNPIGSGDAMAAGLAAGIVRGLSFADACRLGVACGTANAMTLTAGTVQPEQVERLFAGLAAGEGAPALGDANG